MSSTMTRLALVRRRLASAWTRRATPDGRLTLWRLDVRDALTGTQYTRLHQSAPTSENGPPYRSLSEIDFGSSEA